MKRIKSISKFSKELTESINKLDENKLDELIKDSAETANSDDWWVEKRIAEIVWEIAMNEKNIREDAIAYS
jgi:hypothetical protein